MLRVTEVPESTFSSSCDENNNAVINVRWKCKGKCESILVLWTIGKVLTFHFYHGKPSSKGGAILLYLTVVVAILGVACRNSDGGIRICAALMSDTDTRHGSFPLVCTTSRVNLEKHDSEDGLHCQ